MYLITIEGGDGSGKGLASRIICELLERDGSFTSVDLTAEPRRKHPLGRAAIDAVKEKNTLLNTKRNYSLWTGSTMV